MLIGLVAGLVAGMLWITTNQYRYNPASEFWEYMSFGGSTVEVEYYSSLEDAVRNADLVITGTVDSHPVRAYLGRLEQCRKPGEFHSHGHQGLGGSPW